jgi:gliding motility-associated-like protein
MASFPCAQVTAAFKDSLNGCNSLTDYFSDQSTGTVGLWNWNFGDPASGAANISQLQNPSHAFSSAGTYTVTLIVSTGNNMCYSSATDSVSMIVHVNASGLSLSTIQNNLTCNGSCNASASVTVQNGSGPYSFLWNNGSTSASVSSLCAGTYSVTVTDAGGCTSKETVVIPNPLPFTFQAGGNTTICSGTSATLTAFGGATYLWSTGETSSAIVVSPLSATSYSVTSWLNGCSAELVIPVLLKNISVELGTEMNLCGKSEIEFGIEPVNGNLYQWSTGETGNSITVSSPGAYWVTIINSSCKASDTVVVAGDPAGESSLFIPNAFTPNHDGLNDHFRAIGSSISEFHMMIFNRWGELIFQSDEIQSGWDGTLKNVMVQQDVYVVKMKYKTFCAGDSYLEKISHVSVIN